MKRIEAFWGEYRWLSNFYACRVEHEGIVYPSVEHAYQAAKTDDHEARLRIRALPTPRKAKRAGRKVTLRPTWEVEKLDVMRKLVMEKFTRTRELRDLLLATDDAELIEGNYWGDRFWGMTTRGGRGGENWLGKILMEVREALAKMEAGK